MHHIEGFYTIIQRLLDHSCGHHRVVCIGHVLLLRCRLTAVYVILVYVAVQSGAEARYTRHDFLAFESVKFLLDFLRLRSLLRPKICCSFENSSCRQIC